MPGTYAKASFTPRKFWSRIRSLSMTDTDRGVSWRVAGRQRLEAVEVAVRDGNRHGLTRRAALHEHVGIGDRTARAVDDPDHEGSGGGRSLGSPRVN